MTDRTETTVHWPLPGYIGKPHHGMVPMSGTKAATDTPVPPAVVVSMSSMAHQNNWGCWVQDIPSNLFNDWTWIEGGAPAEQAMLVLAEIDHLCMVDVDAGEDGVPVVTFGLFEFECPNLHANLFDLVADFIDARLDRHGHIDGAERDRALRLARGLERAASMIRERLS